MTRMNFLTLAALVASLSVAGVASAQTPIAYYNFDNNIGSNIVADQSGNGFDAVWQGDLGGNGNFAAYGQGIVGGAWNGSGDNNDHFRTASLTALSGIEYLTISLWFNADSLPGGQDGLFVAREAEIDLGTGGDPIENSNFGLSLQSDLAIDSRLNGAQVDGSSNDIQLGEWVHVASVYDGLFQTHTVYINGVQEGLNNTSVPADLEWLDAGEWLIGEDSCCNGREFNGRIDDLAVFDLALSASDISDIYNDGIMGIALDGTVDNSVPGDVDGDGDVDRVETDNDFVSDFDTIANNFLMTGAQRSDGDLTLDGVVDLRDFRVWKNIFEGGSGSASASIPEPSTLVLLGLALSSLGLRCRR